LPDMRLATPFRSAGFAKLCRGFATKSCDKTKESKQVRVGEAKKTCSAAGRAFAPPFDRIRQDVRGHALLWQKA